MAAITIPDSVKGYFPQTIDPTQLWVNYNPKADSLTVYFTDQPVPSVWEDIDKYVYIGFASDDEKIVTGVMIEHFSKWLLASACSRNLLGNRTPSPEPPLPSAEGTWEHVRKGCVIMH